MTARATIRRAFRDKPTVSGFAHQFAPPRITASNVARYGSFDAAKREIWDNKGERA